MPSKARKPRNKKPTLSERLERLERTLMPDGFSVRSVNYHYSAPEPGSEEEQDIKEGFQRLRRRDLASLYLGCRSQDKIQIGDVIRRERSMKRNEWYFSAQGK